MLDFNFDLEKRRTLQVVLVCAIFGWPSVARALDEVEQWFEDDDEEQLVVFPTYATIEDGGALTIPLHVWTFESEEDSAVREAFVSMLRDAIGLDSEETGTTFERRIRPFLVDNERGKRVSVQIGDQAFEVGVTRPDGHVSARVEVPREVAAEAVRLENGERSIAVTVDAGFDQRKVEIPLIEDRGWSVISDIDDTIKKTRVLDRSEMLERTFLEEFRSIDGMASFFRGLRGRLDARFHYLSASPWQLLGFLQPFLRESGFPPGTFHLRKLRPKSISSPMEFISGSSEYKKSAIDRLVSDFPERRFILVGDSGDHDPEVYATIARRYPDNVRSIWIRRVDGADNSDARFAEAFEGVDAERWHVFGEPAELDVTSLTDSGEHEEKSDR